MQPAIDPYQVLGIDRLATDPEIETAWKRRRNRLQPRSERGERDAESELQLVNAAHLAIGDARRREREAAAAAAAKPTPVTARPPPRPPPRRPPRRPQTEGVACTIEVGSEIPRWHGATTPRDIRVGVSLPWLLAFCGGPCQLDLDVGEHGRRAVQFPVPVLCTAENRWTSEGGGVGGGHLYLHVAEVRPHRFFRLDGQGNVHLNLRVSYADVYRGATLTIPGPWGDVAAVLKPDWGEPLRFKGHGIRTAVKQGDLVVALEVVFPEPGDVELGEALRRRQRGVKIEAVRCSS